MAHVVAIKNMQQRSGRMWQHAPTILSSGWVSAASAFIAGISIAYATVPVKTGDLDRFLVVDLVQSDNTGAVAVSTDGSRLISVENGPGTADNTGAIRIIDTDGNDLLADIPLDVGFPLQAVFSPDGGIAYVTVSQASGAIVSTGSNRVDVVDMINHTVTASIPIGGNPFGPTGVAITPDGAKLYVAHRASERIDIVDTVALAVTGSIPVGSEVIEVAVTADGSRAYATSRLPALTVTVVDVATDTISTTIATSLSTSVDWASVSLDTDQRLAYITSTGDSRVSVIDTDPFSATFNQEINVIATNGSSLQDAAIAPGHKRLFAASRGTDELIVVDVDPDSADFLTQIDDVSTAATPFQVATQPLAVAVAYVSARDRDRVVVVDIGSGDFDGDTIVNGKDNCTATENPEQRDTDVDGAGNICDPDLNNDCQINFADLQLFKARIFGTDPDADLNGDGTVNFLDLQIVKERFFGEPGPSATGCI